MTDVVLRVVGEEAGAEEILQSVAKSLDNIDKNTTKATKSQKENEQETKKQASALSVLNKGLGSALIQYQGFQSILGDIQAAFDKTTGAYLAQADAVRELSQFTGATITETSKLMEIFDDAGVEVENLRTGMRYLADNGIEPSVESIARLADEYRAIESPVERVTFLTENFGARGAELGKIFDLTGDEIREASVGIGNALTEEDIRNAEELRKAWDSLNDTFAAVNNAIQRRLVPGFANLVGGVQLLIDALMPASDETYTYAESANEAMARATLFNMSLHENELALQGVSGETAEAWNQYQEYSTKAADAARKSNEFTEAQKRQAKALEVVNFAIAGKLGKSYDDFRDKSRALEVRAGELRAEIEKLTKWGYSPAGEKISALREELDSLNGEYADNYEAMQRSTAEMIYQQAAASGLADPALLELARQLGAVSESDYNLITATQALNDKFKDKNDPEGYTTAMLALYDAAKDGVLTLEEIQNIMDGLDGKVSGSTINIHTNYTSSGTPPTGSTGAGAGGGQGSFRSAEDARKYYESLNPDQFAVGGFSSGGMALVGEQGPELVDLPRGSKVYNASETSAMMGGNWNVSIVIPGAGDPAAVARAVRAELAKTAERQRATGQTGRR